MLRNISWANYAIFIFITLVIYYLTIGFLYYANEIKQLLSGKSNLFFTLNPATKSITFSSGNGKTNEGNENIFSANQMLQPGDKLLLVVNQFKDEIQHTLDYAANKNLLKQEIIYSLQQVAKKYPSIKDSSFEIFIKDFILIECINCCSIHLNEGELQTLWIA